MQLVDINGGPLLYTRYRKMYPISYSWDHLPHIDPITPSTEWLRSYCLKLTVTIYFIQYSPHFPNSFIENSTSVNLRIARCRVKLYMNDALTLNLELNSYYRYSNMMLIRVLIQKRHSPSRGICLLFLMDTTLTRHDQLSSSRSLILSYTSTWCATKRKSYCIF